MAKDLIRNEIKLVSRIMKKRNMTPSDFLKWKNHAEKLYLVINEMWHFQCFGMSLKYYHNRHVLKDLDRKISQSVANKDHSSFNKYEWEYIQCYRIIKAFGCFPPRVMHNLKFYKVKLEIRNRIAH